MEDFFFWLQHNWRSVVEVGILAFIIYIILKFIQQARGVSIVRGMLFVGVIAFVSLYFSAKWLELPNINWLLGRFIPLLLVILLIIFQPEIRHILVRIGQENQFMRLFAKKRSRFVKTLVNSAFKLSSRRIGALIALKRDDSLKRFEEGGVSLNSDISPELILSIFWPGSTLHDGGIIVTEQKILAAGCLFPLSENPNLDSNFGTRHRAGIGLTEENDAVVIIVSEETGKVSVAVRGHLTYDVRMETLESILNELYNTGEASGKTLDVSEES